MKVKIIKEEGSLKVGDIIEVTPMNAKDLIEDGVAELYDDKEAKLKKTK
jgi:hypothetical protein